MRVNDLSFIQTYVSLDCHCPKSDQYFNNWYDWFHLKKGNWTARALRKGKLSPKAIKKAVIAELEAAGYTEIEVYVLTVEVIGRKGRKSQSVVDYWGTENFDGRWKSVDEFVSCAEFEKLP